jgi:hypothetical protein
VASGLDRRTIVRLGWELNGDWYAWSAHDPAAFVGCWRKVVAAAESVAPALRWDWSIVSGPGHSVRDAAVAWPGDEWVDIVGIDLYDRWPFACDEAGWRSGIGGGPLELDHWLAFAKAHGKPLSVPEWGTHLVHKGDGSPCPDNTFYVEAMAGFFAANSAHLAYESYFNESADDYRGAIFDPVQQPKASQAYAQRFRR